MKFKTLRTSETGKKFQAIVEKEEKAFEEAKSLADEIGFEKWRSDRWAAFGGIEFVYFADQTPDPKVWRNTDAGAVPRRNTKPGKAMYERLEALTKVSKHELNMCIGFDGAPFKNIGFSYNNPDYFLFEVFEKWDCEIPADCEEITVSEYRKLSLLNQ
ncbi:hypothetical protein [Mangrovibacterium sp.]|uniref:hypothetical protein n=1 Tax=Mangrovibacterium sp. TaxID=1961364 RepID=UPI003565C90C